MNPHDPSLTAHVLGEPDAAVAEALAHDPALAAEAAEIQRFAAQLRAEFQAESALPLRPEQRAAVLSESRRLVEGPAHWWQRGWAATAAAACAVAAVGTGIYFQGKHLAGLRPVAGPEGRRAEGVKVRWLEENPSLAPNTVPAPKASPLAARPSYQLPAPEVTHAPSPVTLPATSPKLDRPPTLALSTPAPAPSVDPASVPFTGSRPTTPAGRRGITTRAAAKPPATPARP